MREARECAAELLTLRTELGLRRVRLIQRIVEHAMRAVEVRALVQKCLRLVLMRSSIIVNVFADVAQQLLPVKRMAQIRFAAEKVALKLDEQLTVTLYLSLIHI